MCHLLCTVYCSCEVLIAYKGLTRPLLNIYFISAVEDSPEDYTEFEAVFSVEYKIPYLATDERDIDTEGNSFKCFKCAEIFKEKKTYKTHLVDRHQFFMY